MENLPELIVIFGLGVASGMLLTQRIYKSKINTFNDIIGGYESIRYIEMQLLLSQIESEIENADNN